MPPVPVDVSARWVESLATATSGAICELALLLGDDSLTMLAFDCHPWHGSLDLAALTATEAVDDPELADPSEMASWRHFNFSESLPAWSPVAPIAEEMKAAYHAAARSESADHAEVVDECLRICAQAARSVQVATALEGLNRLPTFRVSVAHPDSGREYMV